MQAYILDFAEVTLAQSALVGGKNAALGELMRALARYEPAMSGTTMSGTPSPGARVPSGFAVTAAAYRDYLQGTGLSARIEARLSQVNLRDREALAAATAEVRSWIADTPLPTALTQALGDAWRRLFDAEDRVAVRPSPCLESGSDESLVGLQESLLNIRGLENLYLAVHQVFTSAFSDRAIAYRLHRRLPLGEPALSVGIQKMVTGTACCSGAVFTQDTDTGFGDVVLVTSSYGLGGGGPEAPAGADEFHLDKPNLLAGRPALLRRYLGSKARKQVAGEAGNPAQALLSEPVSSDKRRCFSLSDGAVQRLAHLAVGVEAHFNQPMELEWACPDGKSDFYLLQARPARCARSPQQHLVERFLLKEQGIVLVEGRSVGQRIASGMVRVAEDPAEASLLQEGEVLVTGMTDPAWEPVLRRAAAIITDRGGRTCHAAIMARELGIPAIVGSGDATGMLRSGQPVTVSCAEGDTGRCYAGTLDFEHQQNRVDSMPRLPFRILMNIANPDRAFDYRGLPNEGVGLARLEFLISRMIGIHPQALLDYDQQPLDVQAAITRRSAGYASPVAFYVDKLVEGIATLAAAFRDKPVIVRLSDFKSNEYQHMIGGQLYEPGEENPMLGFRGASRYISPRFRGGFELECQALKRVREEMGFTNVAIMVPFVRTPGEARQVTELLAEKGLRRGEQGLQVMMMCELPANALLAEQFLEFFDGFSIGTNDLTQLALGLDRDSALVSHLFDERNDAVKRLLQMAIDACRQAGKYVGICGQGPSDHPDLARWLMEAGVDSISLNPDSVLDTWFYLAEQQGRARNTD